LGWLEALLKSIMGGSLMYSMFQTFLMRPTSDNPAHERLDKLAMVKGRAALAAAVPIQQRDIAQDGCLCVL